MKISYKQDSQMRKQELAIIGLTLWLIMVALYTLLSERFDAEFFFVLSFLGLIIIMQLMEPDYVRPGYMKNIRYLIAIGIVIFGIIVANKVLDILGWRIVFL
jgi:hypothetical protein